MAGLRLAVVAGFWAHALALRPLRHPEDEMLQGLVIETANSTMVELESIGTSDSETVAWLNGVLTELDADDPKHPVVSSGSLVKVAQEWDDLRGWKRLGSDRLAFTYRYATVGEDLDALVTFHNLLMTKLKLKPVSWKERCEGCDAVQLQQRYNLQVSPNLGGQTQEKYNEWEKETQCSVKMLEAVRDMREVIHQGLLASEQIMTTFSAASTEDIYDHLMDASCEGDRMYGVSGTAAMARSLHTWDQGRLTSMPFCKEMGENATRLNVTKSCTHKCTEMEDCAAFSLRHGRFILEELPVESPDEIEAARAALAGQEESRRLSDMAPPPSFPRAGEKVKIEVQGTALDFAEECGSHPLRIAWAENLACEEELQYTVVCGRKFVGCYPVASLQLRSVVLKTAVEKNTCCFTHQVLKAEEKAAVECFQKPVGLKGMNKNEALQWLSRRKASYSKPLTKVVNKMGYSGSALTRMGLTQLMGLLNLTEANAMHFLCEMATSTQMSDDRCSKNALMDSNGFAAAGDFLYTLVKEKGTSALATIMAAASASRYLLPSTATESGDTLTNTFLTLGGMVSVGIAGAQLYERLKAANLVECHAIHHLIQPAIEEYQKLGLHFESILENSANKETDFYHQVLDALHRRSY